ncbi:MAG: SIR2 family protein [Ardenticatenia bacterium]|nr:SIR2 family protein [Ardenticatenia bacterium]
MSDTVLILGAGFSRAAGIPLLGDFVDRMWELSIRGRAAKPLEDGDKQLFAEAMRIREELDGYHGRAAFSDRNIEDLLSILSFNVIGGGKKDRDKLETMSAAIARTIELTCTVRHPGINFLRSSVVDDGPDIYRQFWKALFDVRTHGKQLPTIITFNYDLVLERSLLQVLIGTHFGASRPLPFQRVQVDYSYSALQCTAYDVSYTTFLSDRAQTEGTILVPPTASGARSVQSIELLKLHGSLNFPRKAVGSPTEHQDLTLTSPVPKPYLLPPISNKASGNSTSRMWRTAIERIRSTKNIVIVGYSLPATDTYMQYFLKAGVGPNRDLNRIVVFDPVLYSGSESCEAMKKRYAGCFAPQFRERINFEPSTRSGHILPGTADAFVNILTNEPETLLF